MLNLLTIRKDLRGVSIMQKKKFLYAERQR